MARRYANVSERRTREFKEYKEKVTEGDELHDRSIMIDKNTDRVTRKG